MAERIKLVQGDNLPAITLTLSSQDSGAPLDLSAASTTAVIHFRRAGETQVLATLACQKVDGGGTGKLRFGWPGSTLNVEPGAYEAEVELDFQGAKHTVYEVLKFSIRPQFA